MSGSRWLPLLLAPGILACGQQTIISPTSSLPSVTLLAAAPEAEPAIELRPAAGAMEMPDAGPVEEVPADLAAWAAQESGSLDEAGEESGAEPPSPSVKEVSDDYEELVGPFDEQLIEEIVPEPGPEEAPAPTAETAPPAPPAEEAAAAPAAEALVYDMPIEFNRQVLGYLEIFKTVRRAGFERGLSRAMIYEKRMKAILAEEGLPQDLYYLALIESAFNARAYSRARAMGPWQFIASTGRLYGLAQDWWIDERRDPDKSTRAAARHLRDLYTEFGSWNLALAAYNCGAGRVRRALAASKTGDYWSLKLPSQTRNYVPAYMAAVIIAREPEKHGFQVDFLPEAQYERVPVAECTSLEVAAECAATTVETLKELNPELLRWCTPPMEGEYLLAVPQGTAATFLERYAAMPRDKRVSWRRYRIAPGDTLSQISGRFGTPVSVIARVNNIRANSIIRAGAYLVIPVPAAPSALSAEETQRVAVMVNPPRESGGEAVKVAYRVRPGDNLWYIAQRHGVTVDQLRAWNPDLQGNLLYSGDHLTVWSHGEPPEAAEEAAARQTAEVQDLRAGQTYQVKKGDTLWSIARRFDMKVEAICRANGFKSSVTIFPGDTITIPGAGNI